MRKAITGALIVATAVVMFVLWRRHTEYGIFIGGGSRYWVSKAVETADDSEARTYLRRVVGATQYGVNIAENTVRRLPSREDRARMWRLLIDVAPNENWRNIYSRDLAQEGVAREPPLAAERQHR